MEVLAPTVGAKGHALDLAGSHHVTLQQLSGVLGRAAEDLCGIEIGRPHAGLQSGRNGVAAFLERPLRP